MTLTPLPRLPRCWRLFVLAAASLSLLLGARPAVAQTKGSTRSLAGKNYSSLEFERIERALVRVRGKVDLHPQGKRIESVEIVALPVFEPEDPILQFLNWFHVTTRDDVIEREVLFRVGSRFDQARSDETERNLRDLRLFSVVVALALEGSAPQSVRYVVVTKDLWSLRLSWDGRINKGVVEYLSLQPAESNLLGTGRRLFGSMNFTRRTYSLGLGFAEPRLAGSRTQIIASAALIMGCKSGEVEGSTASFTYGKPLYSTRTRWSYLTSVDWTNSRPPLDVEGNNLTGAICSARAAESLEHDLPNRTVALLPNEYLYDYQSFVQSFTRSFGYRYKTNLSFGLEARRAGYDGVSLSRIRRRSDDGVTELTPEERQAAESHYAGLIPRSSKRINPFFQVQSYATRFHRDINAETLGLQEDVTLLGHVASLRVYPALEALGSSRSFFGVQAITAYATPVTTGFAKLSAAHTVELGRLEQTDASLSLAFRFTSPRLVLGRFVYDAVFVDHYRNFRGTTYTLGGLSRLRGYEPAATVGAHYLISNLEFRTRPLEILTTQLGAALFYDVGDSFSRFDDLKLLHGVGAGIRFLAPQLDRDVFRIDVGFPMPSNAPRGETTVIATFGQAFGVP